MKVAQVRVRCRAVADIADKVRGFVAGGVYLGQQERCWG